MLLFKEFEAIFPLDVISTVLICCWMVRGENVVEYSVEMLYVPCLECKYVREYIRKDVACVFCLNPKSKSKYCTF